MFQFRNLLVNLIAPQMDLLDMTESDRVEIRQQAEMAGAERLQQSLNLLIAREEDLRFTSHPRLVLETIMIKLCRLGEVLSFDALIKKIEGLEKRLSSFPPDEKASVGQLSDPGLDWGLEEKGEGHAEMPADRPQGLDWHNFLDYVSSKNGPMANVLKEWRLLNLTEDTLEIAKGDNSFSSSYLCPV